MLVLFSHFGYNEINIHAEGAAVITNSLSYTMLRM